MKPTPITHGIKRKPVCTAALLCLMSAAGHAQQAGAPQADAEKATEIVVTGSRIRGVAPVGAAVNAVGRDLIESSGAVNTAQILQEIPQVFNLGVSENSRGQSGGAGNITYGSGINLRGIGPFATLTLLNGHRVVGQGTQGSTVDPSIIPSLALERIEVVADGASAIYGSDAVAGVVNLIMRRGEKGGEGLIRFGTADGYRERQVGALWGTKWKGGQLSLTAENTYRSALSGNDRDFFKADLRAEGGGDFRATQCNPGTIIISGVNYPIPAGGVTPAKASQLVAGAANRCDNLKQQDLIPEQERNSLAVNFNQQLTSSISLFADAFGTRRDYRIRRNALASNLTVPSTNPFYVRPAGAPAGSSETVAYSFINDLGENVATGRSQSWEGTVGAEFTLPAGWKATALVTYGNNDDLSESLIGLNNTAITAALASRDPATALNVFGGANNPATLAAISNTIALSPGDTRFINYSAKADGPLFDLPGGKLRAAFGYEGQNIRTIGGQTTGPATNPTFGEVTLKRTVDSVFAELYVPIVGAANAMSGIKRLDLVAAARADHYSDVGNTSNPKLGLNWVPVDGLTLRGSYGTSFRAPGLTQIRGFTNGGRGGLFVQNYSDPTLNGAPRVGVALSAANPDLKPETATTKTLGFDWTPAFVPRTKLSMSWFHIVYDDQIVGYLSDLTVLNREASFAGTGIIQRNPSPELVAQLLAQYPINNVPPATWTLFVDGRNKNLAKSISQGFDFQAQSRLSFERWGDFVLGLNGTVFTKYKVAQTQQSPLVDQLNTIFNPIKYKARASGQWNIGSFSSTLYINYTGAYDNNLSTPVQRVGSNTTVDLRVAFALEGLSEADMLKDATVALGVTNLFDKKPPFVNIAQSTNGGGGFDPTLSNPLGRVISLSLNKKF